MILRPDQLDTIREPSFSFEGPFLHRLADGLEEFIAADGMLSAGDSPGPMTELRENHTLLLLVIEGAKLRSTSEDQTRASGIQRLLRVLAELDALCRRMTSLSLAELDAQFVAAEADNKPADQGDEAEQIEGCKTSILQSLTTQEEELRRLVLHASVEPLNKAQLPHAINVWQCAARTMIGLVDRGITPWFIEPLEHLGDALDEVKDLLFRHGVDRATLGGGG